jgi:regulator of sigma E protease
VDGDSVRQWSEAVAAIEARPDRDVRLLIGRAGGRITLTAHSTSDLVTDSTGTPRRVGKLRIGVEIPERHVPVNLVESLKQGGAQTFAVSTQIVRVVRGMFSGRVSTREVGGPIAIGVMAGQSAQLGVAAFLAFMAMISVNLAVLNLLPIPVLDGGQFLFLLGEAILRRPLSQRLREGLTFLGLILVALLMVLAFSNDIRRLLGM